MPKRWNFFGGGKKKPISSTEPPHAPGGGKPGGGGGETKPIDPVTPGGGRGGGMGAAAGGAGAGFGLAGIANAAINAGRDVGNTALLTDGLNEALQTLVENPAALAAVVAVAALLLFRR